MTVGIDYLPRLLGRCASPSTTSGVDIFWTGNAFDLRDDSGMSRKSTFALGLKIYSYHPYGLRLNVPGYNFELFSNEKGRNIHFLF